MKKLFASPLFGKRSSPQSSPGPHRPRATFLMDDSSSSSIDSGDLSAALAGASSSHQSRVKVPALALDGPHAERDSVVQTLNAALGVKGSKRSSDRTSGGLLSPRVSSPSPRRLRSPRTTPASSPGRMATAMTTEESESELSPLPLHAERGFVVQVLSNAVSSGGSSSSSSGNVSGSGSVNNSNNNSHHNVHNYGSSGGSGSSNSSYYYYSSSNSHIEDDYDDSSGGSESARSLEDVLAQAKDSGNLHAERDFVVYVLSRKRSAAASVILGGQGGVSPLGFPKRLVSRFEEHLEQRYGSSAAPVISKLFFSIWSAPFAVEFCLRCMDRAQEQDVDRLMCQQVASYFYACRKTAHVIKLAMTREIIAANASAAQATLFRANSVSTAMFTGVYHNCVEGARFLQHTLGPLISKVMALRKPLETEAADVERLRAIFGAFFESVEGSLASGGFPASMRDCMGHLADEMAIHVPHMSRAVLALFLFVRFFCPAVVSPQVYGLAKDAPSTVQLKNLVLVSKVLSNVGTGVRFDGFKEVRMADLNVIVDAFSPSVEKIFDALAAVRRDRDLLDSGGSGRLFPARMFDNNKKFDLLKALEWVLHQSVEWSDLIGPCEEKAKLETLKVMMINGN